MKRVKWSLLSLVVSGIIFGYGLWVYPHSATISSGASLEAPNVVHWLGTDDLGVDIFAQVSRSFFLSLMIGMGTAVLTSFMGGAIGFIAGYRGGVTDQILLFIIDVFSAIPRLPVMILLGTFLGQSPINLIVIITLFSWARIARLIRNTTITEKDKGYIHYARVSGGGLWYIFKKHLSRVLLPLILVNGIRVIGISIISEASLAFVGLINPTQKSLGIMINRALNFPGIYFTNYWKWWMIPPVVVLVWITWLLRELSRGIDEVSQR